MVMSSARIIRGAGLMGLAPIKKCGLPSNKNCYMFTS